VGGEFLALGAGVVTGAVHAVTEKGSEVGNHARSIMVGVLCGTEQVGKASADTVSTNAAALVTGAAAVGGNIAHTARGAIEGAIEMARDLGISVEKAAAAAGSGALKAATDIGPPAVSLVRKTLSGTISGVKVVVKDPQRKPGK
jgi:hypothetical protein